jgi:hypothetical protein
LGKRGPKVSYTPKAVKKGGFSYNFDAIHSDGEKAVFVKVLSDPLENSKQSESDMINKAVMLVNHKYYYSHIFLFAKRCFSDYTGQQAPLDDSSPA